MHLRTIETHSPPVASPDSGFSRLRARQRRDPDFRGAEPAKRIPAMHAVRPLRSFLFSITSETPGGQAPANGITKSAFVGLRGPQPRAACVAIDTEKSGGESAWQAHAQTLEAASKLHLFPCPHRPASEGAGACSEVNSLQVLARPASRRAESPGRS